MISSKLEFWLVKFISAFPYWYWPATSTALERLMFCPIIGCCKEKEDWSFLNKTSFILIFASTPTPFSIITFSSGSSIVIELEEKFSVAKISNSLVSLISLLPRYP